MELSPHQRKAVEAIEGWFGDGCPGGYFVLSGYAGTGKTTLLGYLLQHNPMVMARKPAVVAYTGKAAHVLRQRGVPAASTIHRLIYQPVEHPDGTVTFVRRPSLAAGLVIVDEASMVSRRIHDDLATFRVPILYVGDAAQLEPIDDDFCVMRHVGATLTEIHRQAAGSPIIQFSKSLREGSRRWPQGVDGVLTYVRGGAQEALAYAPDAEQVLCGFNRTRAYINRVMRQYRGYRGLVCPGEKIICLQNNYKVGVFNGMIATVNRVIEVADKTVTLDVKPDFGPILTIEAMRSTFGAENPNTVRPAKLGLPPHVTQWDYGYAVTVHRAQGSQWKSLVVIEELCDAWDTARWTYTAATRAAEQLTYVTPRCGAVVYE